MRRPLFSERYNFIRAVPIRFRNEATDDLRVFVYDALRRYFDTFSSSLDFASIAIGQMPSTNYSRAEESLVDIVFGCKWFFVYDICEKLEDHLRNHKLEAPLDTQKSKEFRELLNSFFVREGFAYKMDDAGAIEHRGDEAFESALDNVVIALDAAGSVTAKQEIHLALADLSNRPNPDLTGAIQHAMAGLECIAEQVCGTSGLELGKIVKSNPEMFPPPLNDVIPKLYGYASNNGRHITEGQTPDFAEAELLVGIAAIVATYLARKS